MISENFMIILYSCDVLTLNIMYCFDMNKCTVVLFLIKNIGGFSLNLTKGCLKVL